MVFLPSVVQAQYRGGFRIRVEFQDGVEATLNFRPWLVGPVFEPLKDVDYFRRFFVDGGAVAWPNGADIAPETLYAAATRTRPKKRSSPAKARRSPRRKAAKK
jgi:hypothetical protein